jgi:ankyrin repeat protein
VVLLVLDSALKYSQIYARHEARVKNDRGNLPLHSACSFRAPIEVAEALLDAYPEAASVPNNYGNLALHFTAWKKGPLDVEELLLKVYPEGAACKNNHGNLPLHYAAHYNAPLEVVQALYNAYPEGALQKNNDNNTPLDLAIADGASANVVALLQGQAVPPSDDELLSAAKQRCERLEKELARHMEAHDGMTEDRDIVLGMLMDIKEKHPHALYSAGIDPKEVSDLESVLAQVSGCAGVFLRMTWNAWKLTLFVGAKGKQ